MAIQVLDANGVPQTIETFPTLGRKAAAQSLSMASSTEDKAVLDAAAASLASILAKIISAPATEAKQDALNALITTQNGYLDGVETTLSSILSKIIAAPATEALQTALNTLVGAQNAAAWTSGDGTLISLLKRIATQSLDTSPVSVALGQSEYETVAASATDQVLGATGATGDYLAAIWIQPGTSTPGSVVVKDGATTVYTFPGGGSSVSNLLPFCWAPGIRSKNGAWSVTTGANVTVQAAGDFT